MGSNPTSRTKKVSADMPIIRALTLMLPHAKDFEVLKDMISGLKEVKELLGDVWTIRVSVGVKIAFEEVKYLINEGFLVNAYHERLKDVDLDKLINYLSLRNTYVALRLKATDSLSDEGGRVFKVLRRVKEELGPEALTRLGFFIGGEIETPYFPLSYPINEGVSVALRYADALINKPSENYAGIITNLLSNYESRIKPVLKSRGLRYLGIDSSLSPWMDESVVPIITELSGSEFPNPGTAYGVRKINDLILESIKRSGTISLGFNEVMLPVGEDNLLKDLVREGRLRLEHLTFLASYCVAGVDMVVIDESKVLVKGVVKDLVAANSVKGRPIGLRLIISDSDEVKLRSFGPIPKIRTSYRS